MTLCAEVDVFSTPSLLRAAIDAATELQQSCNRCCNRRCPPYCRGLLSVACLVTFQLKALYTSSIRPHTLVAEGLTHCYRWRASSPFSLSGTGRLGLVLSRNIPFLRTLPPCTGTARHSHTPPTKFADTDASSSAKPAPTSHATTLPATREELQHRQHPTLLSIYSQPNKTRRRPSIA
jgi:hypothetical protein